MSTFPDIPLEAWRPTKNTLHLYCQIVGKIRLAMHPRLNHWWHVPLYVSSRGLTTRRIPYSGGSFEIEFDLIDHRLVISTSTGDREDFALYDGLSVADFYTSIFANLKKLGIEPKIRPIPYEAPRRSILNPPPKPLISASVSAGAIPLFTRKRRSLGPRRGPAAAFSRSPRRSPADRRGPRDPRQGLARDWVS